MSEQEFAGTLGQRNADPLSQRFVDAPPLGSAARPGGQRYFEQMLASGAYTVAPTNHEARIAETVEALNRAVHDARMAMWTVDVQVVEEDARLAQNGPARIVQVKLAKEF